MSLYNHFLFRLSCRHTWAMGRFTHSINYPINCGQLKFSLKTRFFYAEDRICIALKTGLYSRCALSVASISVVIAPLVTSFFEVVV